MNIRDEDVLEYHSSNPPGKVSVTPTKPCHTQRDLSLAYTPGVAVPCLEIERDPSLAYRYTGKGNLVAVVTNGTAVLGLGNIGPLAGKPVMEGKGVLFKRFADIDVFDLELATYDPKEIIRVCQILEPTFGGINLEDIKAPDCFEVEEELRRTMKIPVFHDDQHGTAIISGAALINALLLVKKPIDTVKVVFNGAGASAIACADHAIQLGVRRENLIMCDTSGVIYRGRQKGMNRYKERFASGTSKRTLAEAMEGADVFFGLSVAGAITPEMLLSMAPRPIVFALANPDPEIPYDVAVATRPDAIVATGRSDYPNQVNNVLGFPFIFRGALDVRATVINEAMKLAATHALADLAREDVPDSVRRTYGLEYLEFGPEYIIPKPFDPRVLIREASAVAKAAMDSGVAQRPIDLVAYRDELERRLGRVQGVMRTMITKAQTSPKRVVFPEGEEPKILRACQILVDDKIAIPILLGKDQVVWQRIADLRLNFNPGNITIVDPEKSPGRDAYIDELYRLRQRKGVTRQQAGTMIANRNLFAALMVLRRCRCRHRRPDAALFRNAAAGAGGDPRAPRVPQSLRRVPHDHSKGRRLLFRGRNREHRAQLRRPGRNRNQCGGDGRALQCEAACGAAVVLEFRQHPASVVREGTEGGRHRAAARAAPDGGRRDAGRHRGGPRDHRGDLSVQHAKRRGQRAGVSEPRGRQRRVQAAIEVGRSRSRSVPF